MNTQILRKTCTHKKRSVSCKNKHKNETQRPSTFSTTKLSKEFDDQKEKNHVAKHDTLVKLICTTLLLNVGTIN